MLVDAVCSLPSDTPVLIGISGGDEVDDEEKGHQPIEMVESNCQGVTGGWHQNESSHSDLSQVVRLV
jgi:hypothetical protein